jgi:hypothetical protein
VSGEFQPFVNQYLMPSAIKEDNLQTFIYASSESDGAIDILKQTLSFELTELSNKPSLITNVIVAPDDCEFEIRRVTVSFGGRDENSILLTVNIKEVYLGNLYNPNTQSVPVNVYTVNFNTNGSDNGRQIDVPMRIGKNLRAFQVQVVMENCSFVIEALQIEYILRKRPISRGINPNP